MRGCGGRVDALRVYSIFLLLSTRGQHIILLHLNGARSLPFPLLWRNRSFVFRSFAFPEHVTVRAKPLVQMPSRTVVALQVCVMQQMEAAAIKVLVAMVSLFWSLST